MIDCEWRSEQRCGLAEAVIANITGESLPIITSEAACQTCQVRHERPTIEAPGTVVASLTVQSKSADVAAAMKPHFASVKARKAELPASNTLPVIAPDRASVGSMRHEGTRPWIGKRVTAIIPTMSRDELLDMCIESLLLQTEPPLILIVDTGSVGAETAKLDALRRRNEIEVISTRQQGYTHPSEPVAIALDAAFACVHTEFAYLTHDDCVAKRQDLIEDMVSQCGIESPAVGYRISQRHYPEWVTELGHTCTLLHVPTMDRIGLRWSMRAYCHVTGKPQNSMIGTCGDPDTEREMNRILAANGIVPVFIGDEINYERTNDGNIDHCRSRTSAHLYRPDYAAKADAWGRDAVEQARTRHAAWRPDELACPHRGEKLRVGSCDLCGGGKGQPFEVLACGKFGECSLSRRHSKVRGCVACIASGQNLFTP